MISLKPLGANPAYTLVPLSAAAGHDRHVPKQWLAPPIEGGVAQPFIDYVKPLVGPLLDYPTDLI
jgi:hypothetical protein